MALAQLTCPICDADFPLGGDEKAGEEVFCSYCGSPCKLTAITAKTSVSMAKMNA